MHNLTTDERITKLKAAAWAFREELATLGMDFAAVVIDPQLQRANVAHLLYVGSLLKDAGGKTFQSWLNLTADPNSKVALYEEYHSQSGPVQ